MHRVLSAIDNLYTPVDPSALVTHISNTIAALIPHRHAAVDILNHETGHWEGVQTADMTSLWKQRAAELIPESPLMRYLKDGGQNQLLRLNSFFFTAELRKSPLFQELLAPLGVEYQLAAVLKIPRCSAYFSVLRERDFNADEIQLMGWLQPHLVRVYIFAQLRANLRANQIPGSTNAPDVRMLTPREREVLHWIAQGKRDSEIGTILGISTRTVHKHVSNSLSKLGLETRTAAAALWSADDEAPDAEALALLRTLAVLRDADGGEHPFSPYLDGPKSEARRDGEMES
jgi:DNA-binding CsgD family transcriptional regulator